MILTFLVRNQTLTYLDTKLVPRIGSAEYLQLKFKFITSDWVNLRKTIQISSGEYSESYILESDIFDVPTYYTQQGSFDITFLGDRGSQVVPTNVITVKLSESNRLWTAEPPDPQNSAYIELLNSIGNLNDLTTEAKNNLVAAINEAAQSGGGGGSTVELDTTLSEAGKAADAKAVGDALAVLENKIPTASGGMSVTAADLLVTILRNAEYSTDQSDNITALTTALNATPEPDVPDVPVVRYAITNNLTECVNSNATTSLTEGASYTATLTASDGFVLDAVTVTMGGVDVTATVYVDGTITIPSVTGDVIITAVAVAVEEVLPFENGKTYTSAEAGYTEGYFVNGDGLLTENANFAYVEFPCRGASRIILNKNAYEGNHGVICVDAEKKWVANGKMTSVTADDGTKTFDASVPRNVEYARIMARKGDMPNLTITPIQDPMWDGTYEIGKWYRMPYKDGCQFSPSTGVVTEGGGSSCVTDFMSIYGVTSGEIRNNQARSFVMFYDADKNYISNVIVQSTTTFTVPEGAMWMRYGVNMENVNFVIKVTA